MMMLLILVTFPCSNLIQFEGICLHLSLKILKACKLLTTFRVKKLHNKIQDDFLLCRDMRVRQENNFVANELLLS